jgi:hypothetical protein
MSSSDDRPSALNGADPVRNFSLSMAERVRAMAIGVPAYAARKRRIEDAEARYVAALLEIHEDLVAKGRSKAAIDDALEAAAHAIDLTKVNALVVTHNRYYPIEANLPMDRRGRGYLVSGHLWEPEQPYTAERLLTLARATLDRRASETS